ncbi:MAG: glycosyltransferase family 2 protein [Lachnospiraceae bacterium]|nr:glycosyltransferase family 2 protein [Lachnospiraceae bacterium]
MSIPIITVIIPIYNEKEYIDRCMNSIQSQTHRRLQVILVDGGSDDGSAEICDKWGVKWNMGPNSNMGICEVIHTSNQGVSASRNQGLAHATGELVTFVDGDDYLEPDALSRMVEVMTAENADMVGCDFASIYPDGPSKQSKPAEPADSAKPADLADDTGTEVMSAHDFMEKHILHGDLHVWGRLYKRSIIGADIRFKQGLTIGEDMLFVMEYVRRSSVIVHMSYKGYDYFRNPHGAMGKPFTKAAMDQVRCWEEAKSLLKEYDEELADSNELKANMLISVMLTACRMALLDKTTRKDEEHRNYTNVLRSKIKEYKTHKSMKLLDRGYRTKVRLFKAFPGLFMSMYNRHKS